ncbi:hypothetical protein S83_001718 [Arachis hypogaea]
MRRSWTREGDAVPRHWQATFLALGRRGVKTISFALSENPPYDAEGEGSFVRSLRQEQCTEHEWVSGWAGLWIGFQDRSLKD